jgi:hypothetical protein
LNSNSSDDNGEASVEMELFRGQCNRKCRYLVGSGTFYSNMRILEIMMATLLDEKYCNYCHKSAHVKHNCFNFKKKTHGSTSTIIKVIVIEKLRVTNMAIAWILRQNASLMTFPFVTVLPIKMIAFQKKEYSM